MKALSTNRVKKSYEGSKSGESKKKKSIDIKTPQETNTQENKVVMKKKSYQQTYIEKKINSQQTKIPKGFQKISETSHSSDEYDKQDSFENEVRLIKD